MADREEVIGFNISAFMANVAERGLISTSKFMAYFPLPPGMLNRDNTAAYSEVAREINMWCDGASIPGVFSQGPEIRQSGYGPTEKRAISAVFPDVDLTFIVDASSRNWHLFRSWMNLKHNYDGAKGLYQSTSFAGRNPMSYGEIAFPEDYLTNVIISQFSDDGTEQSRVILRDAHPVAVSPMKLSWKDDQQIGRFSATIAMTDWYFDFEAVSNTLDGGTRPTFQPLA